MNKLSLRHSASRSGFHRKLGKGFTLIEMLVVVAIVLILLGIAARGIGSYQRGLVITEAASSVHDLLTLGRLEAVARNRLVEARFIRREGDASFRYVALVLHESDGSLSLLSRVLEMPQAVVFANAPLLSPLLNNLVDGNEIVPIPVIGAHTYRSFRYRPDGSTDLPASPPPGQVTIIFDQQTANPAANFAAIQVQAMTGKVTTHRP